MKKILNFICALSILGLSTSQVLSCNHNIPNPSSNTKSDLSKNFYNENSLKDESSLAIHGLKSGDSITNLKTAIYQYILNKYNAKHSLKTITLADVKNDLSLKIFDKNQEITSDSSIKDFTKYSVLITANKNAKYFFGSNQKENFIVDLTQLNLDDFKLPKNYDFTNAKPEAIKTGIETKISKWYWDQEKSKTNPIPEAFTSADVDSNLDIKVTASKNPTNSIKQKQWDVSYSTRTKNEPYFFDVPKNTKLKNKINDYFLADFNDIRLDEIYSAVNSRDLYNKVYTQAAKLVNSSQNLDTNNAITPIDIKNDKNFQLSIFYIGTRNKHIFLKDTTATFPHEQTLCLNVNIAKNDKYFLSFFAILTFKHKV